MELNISITPSIVLEFLYCPRFIYFMKVLNIEQNEEQRHKVIEGREVHLKKSLDNKEYLRKNIKVKEKLINQPLYSKKHCIHGIVDEILLIEDGSASPLDYKFAEYKDRVYEGYRAQLIIYSILIYENMKLNSNVGYLVYTRTKNKLVEVCYDKKEFDDILITIEEILKIIDIGIFPKQTKQKSKCIDCCYKNLCS